MLVIDDEPSIRKLAERELVSERRLITTASSASEALSLIEQQDFDVIILDIRLPDADGMDLLVRFRETLPDVEVVIITGYGTIESAIAAMKVGAYDYITKPFQLEHLELIVEKAYERVSLKRENRILSRALVEAPIPRLVGTSRGIQQVMEMIRKVATWDVPVLITGESGTGKDVVARTIHALSKRSEKPLIVKNCGEIQKDLIRSELFGHVKGAFTGADQTREGLLGIADRGTLFLDEIGELPEDVQAALLRFLENRCYRRVGDPHERRADVRLIFATHRDLKKEVEAGRFHEALYYRINVFHIHIPPLRERREDIPLLVEHFLTRLSPPGTRYRITDDVLGYLINYNWPGNVRELRNVIERAIILAENELLTPKTLPMEITSGQPASHLPMSSLKLSEMEKYLIQKALSIHRGNKRKAAQSLGISRKTLYRKMKTYGLLKREGSITTVS
ncbi:two-component system, NtrC family, response regulator [Thermodesulforhabdus norvegica]|uniref:Two-component system, NtrC family, response regulator n=1 Tax=Thermodesulforhabdus norvegica TaxID=39841 RepID=A0A1I4WAL0_9BACT|nr:two-component system, NtrC family, response regulator [Thermodesulforhabdus norvegica]